MKLLDSLLHSQRWDLSKEIISLTQPPSAQMIPGRREIQLETKHNKIYNKYNIAELQVFTGSILLFTLTANGLGDQSHTISTCRAPFATSTGEV